MLLAVLGGTLLFLAHPPAALGVLGLVAIAPLVALARNLSAAEARLRTAWGYGTVAGLVTFLPLVSWLVPFGYVPYVLLTVIQAAFVGAFVVSVHAYGERRGRAAFTVAAWVAIEVIRGSWPLGGFSWGILAYTQADGGIFLGAARTVGTFGVCVLAATVAVCAEEIVRGVATAPTGDLKADRRADAIFNRIRVALLSVLGVLVVGVLLSGEPPTASGQTVEIGIAQAGDTRATSAAGVNRIDDVRIEAVADLVLEATRPFADDPPDLLIWPENSLDRDVRFESGTAVRERLNAALQLVAPTPILAGETARGPRPRTLYNQMTVFTTDGIGESYVKRQPVPFGEYVPARAALDWFPPLEQIPNDVLAADDAQVLDVAGASIGGVICFENTFPRLAIDQVRAGADVLVVSTNNSSFGDTAMSRQHIAFSRVRAVETGRWVVHAGISGISAFIGPDGELLQQTGLFEVGAPRMEVPLINDETVAVRLGGAVATASVVLLVLGLLFVGVDVVRRRPSEDAVD